MKGSGGLLWVQVMENKSKCLVVKWGHGGNFAEKFVKNIVPSQSYPSYRIASRLSLLGDDWQ